MIFDRVIANLPNADNSATQVDDWLDLRWRECLSRAARFRTRAGKDIRVLLPLGTQLTHGDVISNGTLQIGVEVRPCDVLLLHPPDAEKALLSALGLGNLHAPVQLDGNQLVALPDGPVEELLQSLGVPYTSDVRRFQPASIAAPLRAQLASQFQIVMRSTDK